MENISKHEENKETDLNMGYIYCFSNSCMPNILKIGMTNDHPDMRLNYANSPNTFKPPAKYKMELYKRVKWPRLIEGTIHNLLEICGRRHLGINKEFFTLSIEEATYLFSIVDKHRDEIVAISKKPLFIDTLTEVQKNIIDMFNIEINIEDENKEECLDDDYYTYDTNKTNINETKDIVNTCEYCNTTFSSKYVLARHINSSKRCIDLRTNNYVCEHCEFHTNRKSQYDTHIKTCDKLREYKDNLIIEMKSEIKRLNSELEYNKQLLTEQLNKPTTTNNITNSDNRSINNVSNKIDINLIQDAYKKMLSSIEELEEKLPEFIENNLTLNDIKKGLIGIVQMVSKILYSDSRYFIASDILGKNFHYKKGTGNVIIDDYGKYLTAITLDAIEPVMMKLADKRIKEICEQSVNLSSIDRIPLDNERRLLTRNVQAIKNEINDNKKYRKLQAERAFISDKKIMQNIENPLLLLTDNSEYKTDYDSQDIDIELIPLSDIMNRERWKYEISKLSPEDLKYILSDVNNLIFYTVDTFLCINNMLLYKYNKEKDCFNYYGLDIKDEGNQQNLIIYEDTGETVYHFVNRLNIPYSQRTHCLEEYKKMKDITCEEFTKCLKRYIYFLTFFPKKNERYNYT